MKFAENLLGFLRMPQINPYLAVKIISLLIGITVIAFSLFTGWVFLRAKQSFDGFNMAEVIKYNPKLVFKRATLQVCRGGDAGRGKQVFQKT